MIRKYKNLIYASVNLFSLSIINTIKGGVIMECGYNYLFWITELISLLFMISLLYFLYKTINEGKCTTVKREVKDEIHN